MGLHFITVGKVGSVFHSSTNSIRCVEAYTAHLQGTGASTVSLWRRRENLIQFAGTQVWFYQWPNEGKVGCLGFI